MEGSLENEGMKQRRIRFEDFSTQSFSNLILKRKNKFSFVLETEERRFIHSFSL